MLLRDIDTNVYKNYFTKKAFELIEEGTHEIVTEPSSNDFPVDMFTTSRNILDGKRSSKQFKDKLFINKHQEEGIEPSLEFFYTTVTKKPKPVGGILTGMVETSPGSKNYKQGKIRVTDCIAQRLASRLSTKKFAKHFKRNNGKLKFLIIGEIL